MTMGGMAYQEYTMTVIIERARGDDPNIEEEVKADLIISLWREGKVPVTEVRKTESYRDDAGMTVPWGPAVQDVVREYTVIGVALKDLVLHFKRLGVDFYG